MTYPALRFAFPVIFLIAACQPANAPATDIETVPSKIVAETAPAPIAIGPAATASGTPPLIDGIYVFPGCEGEGGCPNKNWRAIEDTPLLAEQRAGAPVIATLTPGEFVATEVVETRNIPSLGVVTKLAADNYQGFVLGETVYRLGYEGEGIDNIWHSGKYDSVSYDDDSMIAWEPDTAVTPAVQATLGLWAKVRRESGETGWVHEPRFECMGTLSGDENCRD